MPAGLTPPLLRFLLLLGPLCLHVSKGANFEIIGPGSSHAPSASWRIVNLDPITYGWAIGEVTFYTDSGCTDDVAKKDGVEWTAMSSGIANRQKNPERAFDGFTWTEWRSLCYMCAARQAYIGLHLTAPVRVLCVKIYQWGEREYLTSRIELQRWTGDDDVLIEGTWQGVLRGTNLVGQWNQVRFVLCEPVAPPEDGRVQLTNDGFYPSEAIFSCSGARIYGGFSATATCRLDGSWTAEAGPCYSLLQLMILVSICIALELCIFSWYFFRIIAKRAPPLGENSTIPEEEDRQWTHALVRGFLKPPLIFPMISCACPCIRLADNWHSAGFVRYHLGVWLSQCICCFWPCIGMAVRPLLRNRFYMKEPMSTGILAWLFCCFCAIAQEGRMLDEMTDVAEHERAMLEAEQDRKHQREEKLRNELERKAMEKEASALKFGRSTQQESHGHGHKAIVSMQSKSILNMTEIGTV